MQGETGPDAAGIFEFAAIVVHALYRPQLGVLVAAGSAWSRCACALHLLRHRHHARDGDEDSWRSFCPSFEFEPLPTECPLQPPSAQSIATLAAGKSTILLATEP